MLSGLLSLLVAADSQAVMAKGFEAFRPDAAWVMDYKPGELLCGAETVPRRDGDTISPALNWFEGDIPAAPATPLLEVRLDLTPEGAARNVRVHWLNEEADSIPARIGHVEAVLVGWRFEPAARLRKDCLLPMHVQATPMKAATRDARLRTLGVSRWMFEQAKEVSPQKDLGHACELKPRLVAYPDIDATKAPPGRRKWTAVGFGVEATGATVDVKIEASSGDPALDSAVVRAVADSTFQPGPPMAGCIAPVEVLGDVVPAPPLEPNRIPAASGRCRGERPGFIRYQGVPSYPHDLRARNIEGRAYVRFDVTPAGRIVGAEVVAAEPSSSFGAAALRYVQRARAEPSEKGHQDCLAPVLFELRD